MLAQRQHAHEPLVRVVRLERGMDVRSRGIAGQRGVLQHDGGRHALVVVIDHRQEDGSLCKTAVHLHLGKVLVREREAVDAGCIEHGRAVRILIGCNHLLASAGIAREREARERVVRRHDARLHERGRNGDEARGVAAGVGDALRRCDRLTLTRAQLGEAVGPARCGAVGGGGVDDAHVGVLDKQYRLACTVVGQAEEHHVGGVDEAAALLGVVALVLVDAEQLEVAAVADAPGDLQSRGAALPVDVDPRLCHVILPERGRGHGTRTLHPIVRDAA